MTPFKMTVRYNTLNSLICSITVEHNSIVGLSCFLGSSTLGCRLVFPAIVSISCSVLFCFCWKNFSILKISLKNSSTFTSILSPSRSWKEPSIHLFAKKINGYWGKCFNSNTVHIKLESDLFPVRCHFSASPNSF